MEKSFKKKYMHPTRRKLVDMVHTGEYATDTSVGWSASKTEHDVGDTWEDETHKFEKKEGYTIKTSKNTDALQKIRDYLEARTKCKNPACKRDKMSHVDAKLIQHTGYCSDCLSVIETEVRIAGIWQDYSNYKVWGKMLVEGRIKLEELKQARDDVKQVYEYTNEDGTLEKWSLPQSVDDAKKELTDLINNGENELNELEEQRNTAFETVRNAGFEHTL